MRMASLVVSVATLGILASGPAAQVTADPWRRLTEADLGALYERLQPGMTVGEVARTAGPAALRQAAEPVTSWLVWSPPALRRPTVVLRMSFRDGRLTRVEYESFGDEYRRLAKGREFGVEIGDQELRRLWRQLWQVTEAAGDCRVALDAFHHLVVQVQERLTTAQQAAWVRALELRRAAEAELSSLDR